jgi:hypothetical protein
VASIDFNGFGLCAPSLAGFPDLALFHANSNFSALRRLPFKERRVDQPGREPAAGAPWPEKE